MNERIDACKGRPSARTDRTPAGWPLEGRTGRLAEICRKRAGIPAKSVPWLSKPRWLVWSVLYHCNQLEALKGNRKGQYSIRVSKQWRIGFRWDSGHASDVEITDENGALQPV